MKIEFPSIQFDEAVSAVCHGSASEEQARALNKLLRTEKAALDAYILRLEIHSSLASNPDLFVESAHQAGLAAGPVCSPSRAEMEILPVSKSSFPWIRPGWGMALAAALALIAAGWWAWAPRLEDVRQGATSHAVAMLSRVVDAQWEGRSPVPLAGAPLEPGLLQLKSGLAQIVFYSGARVIIEGPTELEILTAGEAFLRSGRLVAEVPLPASGFRLRAPGLQITDPGSTFGMVVKPPRAEIHVLQGTSGIQASTGRQTHKLREGSGLLVDGPDSVRQIQSNASLFDGLFNLQAKSTAAEVLRHEQWRASSRRLDEDPSLLVHFDFEPVELSDWRLPNAIAGNALVPDATIIGCQWIEGRWPEKHALEFRGVSDRVRLSVPGEYESITLAVWVRVQGLDREFNSLFMSDGFESGTLHWLIRHDGVLGLTVIGSKPGKYQIVRTPSVLTLDKLGLWVHLAVVVDGENRQAVHYVNGTLVERTPLKIPPPYRVGAAELGNWNASGFPGNDPSLIRNFSGAMDEFCLFQRALEPGEILALSAGGGIPPEPLIRPQARQPKRLRAHP